MRKNILLREGLSYRTALDFDDDFFRVSNKGRKYLFSKTFFFFRIYLDFNIRFYFSCIIVFGLHYIVYSQNSILFLLSGSRKVNFNIFSTKRKTPDRIVKFVKILKNNFGHFSSWTLILPHHSKSINHKKK